MLSRRNVLLSAAVTSIGAKPFYLQASSKKRKVGVVGGGILGAAVAAFLARAGTDVILFEKARPANGATSKSVAWINAIVNDAPYMQLRSKSLAAWHEDDARWKMNVLWGGSINWANDSKKASLQSKAEILRQMGGKPRFISSSEITHEIPQILPGDNVQFAFETFTDGHVDPVIATYRYLEVAKEYGASILYPCEVTKIRMQGNQCVGVETTKGEFALDDLVVASGTDTPTLLALVDRKLTLAHKPGLVVQTTPRPFFTKKVFEASSILEFKQYADGRFLTSFTGGPPDLPVHHDIRKSRIEYPNDALRYQHGAMLIERTAQYMPDIAEAQPAKILIGFRPYPLDNRPIVGWVPGIRNLYVMVTHSGVTLAPILARYATKEILKNVNVSDLDKYRPSRFIF